MEMADARNHFFSQFAIFERSEQPAGEGRRRLRPHLFHPLFVFQGKSSGGSLTAGYSLRSILVDYKRRKYVHSCHPKLYWETVLFASYKLSALKARSTMTPNDVDPSSRTNHPPYQPLQGGLMARGWCGHGRAE